MNPLGPMNSQSNKTGVSTRSSSSAQETACTPQGEAPGATMSTQSTAAPATAPDGAESGPTTDDESQGSPDEDGPSQDGDEPEQQPRDQIPTVIGTPNNGAGALAADAARTGIVSSVERTEVPGYGNFSALDWKAIAIDGDHDGTYMMGRFDGNKAVGISDCFDHLSRILYGPSS